jgi:cyclophilin family peptidyl-prolyl cis-trans isomerase
MAAKKNNSKAKSSSPVSAKSSAKSQPKIQQNKPESSPSKITPVESESYKPSSQSPVTRGFGLADAGLRRKLWAVAAGLAVIGGFIYFAFYFVPNQILANTDEAKIAREKSQKEEEEKKKKAEQETKIEEENRSLKFTGQVAQIQTNYGDIKFDLRDDAAPKTVESFIRLTYRGYFNGLKFHRMVVGDSFKVIQGGDPKGDGTGGESAFGSTLPDELWKVKPEFDASGKITNQPQFSVPELYQEFDSQTGQVVYRKGLLVMAKTQAPDSAGSQFFITLDKTVLPAEYTVFGVVKTDSLATLDKILAEVKPAASAESSGQSGIEDGKPTPDLEMQSVKLI